LKAGLKRSEYARMFSLQHYWSGGLLAANAFIGLNLIGALLDFPEIAYDSPWHQRASRRLRIGIYLPWAPIPRPLEAPSLKPSRTPGPCPPVGLGADPLALELWQLRMLH
jgi:hypothetical protein